jgi:hypothetical protein
MNLSSYSAFIKIKLCVSSNYKLWERHDSVDVSCGRQIITFTISDDNFYYSSMTTKSIKREKIINEAWKNIKIKIYLNSSSMRNIKLKPKSIYQNGYRHQSAFIASQTLSNAPNKRECCSIAKKMSGNGR